MGQDKEQEQERMLAYQVVALGEGAVGKSTITMQFVTREFLDYYDPTIEDLYRKNYQMDDKLIALSILDTAGQDDFSAMVDQWVRESDGYMLIYSTTSRSSYEHALSLYSKIMQSDDNVEKPPIVLVGNKADLVDEREVSREEAAKAAAQMNAGFVEISAKDREQVDDCFYQIVKRVDEAHGKASGEDKGGISRWKKASDRARDVCNIL